MRKWILIVLALLSLLPYTVAAQEAESYAQPPETRSAAYAVIDADSGQVLMEKDGSRSYAPASTTKILTMGLVLESGLSPDLMVETSESAVAEIYYDSTQLYLAIGEELTVEQYLYGTQVRSANDAANVLAEAVAGSQEAFARRMNQKCKELGLSGSQFQNAHGLPAEGHYTTAIDLAQITRWALTQEGFAEIFAAYTYTIPPTNIAEERPMTTTCQILNPVQYYHYPYATGAKLGWTGEANYTLSTVAEKDGKRLICVVLNAVTDDHMYGDTIALLDYAFESFRQVTCTPDPTLWRIPIYDDDRKTAELTVESDSYTLYLHQAYDEDDIAVNYDLPERYDLGDAYAPTAVLRLRGGSSYQYPNLGRYTLPFTASDPNLYEALPGVAVDASVEQRTFADLFRELVWVIVPVSFLVLLLVVSLILQLTKKHTKPYTYTEFGKRRYRR